MEEASEVEPSASLASMSRWMQGVEALTTPLTRARVVCSPGCRHCLTPLVALLPHPCPLLLLLAKEGKFLTLTFQARWLQLLVLELQVEEELVSSC